MTSYIQSIIITGVVSSLVITMLPSDSEGAGKQVRYIAVLLLLLVILTPLSGVSGFIASLKESVGTIWGSTTEAVSGAEQNVVAKTAETLSEYIISVCHDRFTQEKDSLRVKLILDESDPESVRITEVQIFTRELDRTRREEIGAYFEELLQTKVFVLVA